MEEIVDSKGNKITKINNYKNESRYRKSKFVTDKLDEILKNITQLFNDDDQDFK